MKIDKEKLTPMMRQYLEFKEKYSDSIIFCRLGDFYEIFFEDAITVSRELELALTKRNGGLDEKIPMCGVPHHVIEPYISKMVEKGYKICIVDQLEDPKFAKGLVKRGITRIVTPGTLTDVDNLNRKENNFIMSIFSKNKSYGLAYLDISTGEFNAGYLEINADRSLIDLISKVNPSEIIINSLEKNSILDKYIENKKIFHSLIEMKSLDINDYNESINNYLGKKAVDKVKNTPYTLIACSNLLDYIYTFQKDKLSHINHLSFLELNKYMKVDASTRDNLEIFQNLNDKSRNNSLIDVLDKTSTAMASRKLKKWMEMPLLDLKSIEKRLDYVEILFKSVNIRNKLEENLDKIYDIERLISKFSYNRANARDLLALKYSIENLPYVKEILISSKNSLLINLGNRIDQLEDIYITIDEAIVEEPPISITEGGIIKKGFSKDLDELKEISVNGKGLLLEYEKELIKETGIKNLKISFNKNTGHLIDVTDSNKDKVPDYFIRKQTLKSKERYTTEKLDQIADMIMHSKDESMELEYKIFQKIRSLVDENSLRIQDTADLIAELDSYSSLAKVAYDNNYIRPSFNRDRKIEIKAGRHPVIESISSEDFISNDTLMGGSRKKIQIITGPNMAGKSTYMRQNALILIMSQMGSFVPADYCNVPIHDAIFTRIGASDNLSKGDSTFMVEMKEMSNIIKNASPDSFIVLDEVGRGTSTNDGLAIAFSIVEYLSKHLETNTLFATHYHELTILEDMLDNVVNLKVDIDEYRGELVFLRKIKEGRADKSYGIEVAKLSGLPDSIISRARYFLDNLDKLETKETYEESEVFDAYKARVYIEDIKNINVDDLSPIQALNKLDELVKKAGDSFGN